ncbi:hypothetical protein DFH08DRAFT_671314, partial [Mycena albidolilacea]
TGVVYLPGSQMTYTPHGSKQVRLIGNEEKHAFMVLLDVSGAGDPLPIQCIYKGKTFLEECGGAKFCFGFSGKTRNHWSNQKTMYKWVEDVLIPYLNAQRAQLFYFTYPFYFTLKVLVIINIRSIHRSADFQQWLWETHPNIFIDFVPGGCTSI